MKVKCRLCNTEFSLNPDSEEARAAGTDPHQQMRRHLKIHPLLTMQHARRMGWLIDMLAFESTDDPMRFYENVQATLVYCRSPEAMKENR